MVVGLLILVVLAVLAAALVLPRLIAAQLATLRDDTARQLNERNADVDRRLADVTETIDRRLASSNQAATKIHERLGEVTKATAEMNERAKDLARLEQALRPPKARGGFGELLLENLLRDRLPPDAYEIQHTFPGGERVDAVIRAAGLLLPVDAKFPLDNFERMTTAGDEAERQLHEKAFARDVKGHIDAIAGKYIRPGGDPLRAHLRQDRRPAHVRAREARVPRLRDDVLRLPADDRARPQGHADRAAG